MISAPAIYTLIAMSCPLGEHECLAVTHAKYRTFSACADAMRKLREADRDMVAVCIDPTLFAEHEAPE